jgi:hypothetical protein
VANNITVNPWILDTAASASALPMMKRVTVTAFRWDGAGAVSGDTVVMSDKNGNVVWDALCGVTGPQLFNTPMVFPDGGIVCDGLGPTTITHGKVYVYVRNYGT